MTPAAPHTESLPLASVVIVNYNGGAFLQDAINSLARQTFQNFELILLDNASTDGSALNADLSALPTATLVMHPENSGFAGGNNLAARQAKGKWLALLNPDTVADERWLERLIAAAERHPGLLTFASAQLDLSDQSVMDGAGDAYLVFGIPWRGGFGRSAKEMPGEGLCFSACGAAAMYDRQLFLQMGGFDEHFFCYCEDVDLGFRLQLSGYDCLFVPDASVRHAGSGITGRSSAFATFHGTRNRIWTYFKNMPLALLILTVPGHILFTTYIVVHNAFTPRARPMLDGLAQGIKGIGNIRKESAWKVPTRKVSLWQLARKMAWNPLRLHNRTVHVRSQDHH